MKTRPACHRLSAILIAAVVGVSFQPGAARAVTTVFFDISQTTNFVASGTNWDRISSEAYLFTFTRDKLFTGGVGLTNPIGRDVRVPWPDGLEAQAVTAGPAAPGSARFDIARQDGQRFAIESFTAKLLANTFGAGGAIEIMPLLNGEDGVANPYPYDVTGSYGQVFTFNTPELAGFDAYKLTLYVDFALTNLEVVDASIPPPVLDILQVDAVTLQLSWPTNALGYALQSVTNMPATVWDPVTNSADINGDLYNVQLKVTGSQRWFRLRK